MYHIFLYTSNDILQNTSIQENSYEQLQEDENIKICIICWLPDIKNDSMKNLKKFSYISSSCDCNPLLHQKCLKNWITKSCSCPICRKIMKINNFRFFLTNTHLVFFYIFFFNYLSCLLQISNYVSFVNLFIFYIYTIYIIYYFGKNYDYEIYF